MNTTDQVKETMNDEIKSEFANQSTFYSNWSLRLEKILELKK